MTAWPRIVVLDFDGVVLESLDVKARAFAALFSDHPEHALSIIEFHLANGGMSRYEKFRIIHAEILREPLAERDERRLGERFSELVLDEILRCPFVTGADRFLQQTAETTPIYVASGTPEDELRQIVAARGLEPFFAGVYGTPRGKPELLRSICSEAEVDVRDAVLVGDARSDCDAARTVGMPFVARRVPNVHVEFAPEEVMLVVDDLAELSERWPELVARAARVPASP